ncbi:Cytochrome P450 CYP749A22 [Linum perenne]
MASQGIKGPRYRFLLGNTKEINDMITEAVNNPMEISHQMLPRIMPHVHSWTQIYGMNFLNWYGTRPQLVVTDPELVKEKFLGNGLLTSEGEKWVKTRKLANQAFHGDCLKAMIPAMVTSVEAMLQRWGLMEDVKEIDVFPEFKILSSEVISRTAFGSSYEEGRNVFGMLMKLGIIVNRNNFKVGIPGIKKLWRSSDDIESDKLQKDIKEGIIKLIRKREDGTSGSGKSHMQMAMIVNESLRLYPPAFNLTREVARETKLGKFILPAKMALSLPILAVHNNPILWGEDCHLFKPERFADGVAKATKPRTCVGMNFAAAETKIALSMLLQRYKLALSPSYVHAPVHMLTICPKHGLPILLQPLQHCILQ